MSKRILVALALGGILAATLAACEPGGIEPVAPAEQSVGEPTSPALAAVTQTGETAVEAASEAAAEAEVSENVVVDVTPMSDEELAVQPPGQTEPGAGGAEDGEETSPGTVQRQPPGGWSIHSDETYGFSVFYPDSFVVGHPDPALLTALIPSPSDAIYFVDPNIAESAFAGTDAPDLEVRVFESGPVTSLEDWLAAVGAIADGDGKTVGPYQGPNVSGLEVCESNMLSPGCTVFIAGGDHVFQLRVLNLEGETMAQSFSLAGP